MIEELSNELNLSEQQIYKWFWDTKKKVEEDTAIAKQMSKGIREDRGNTWRSDKEVIGVDGRDGAGVMMTPQQIKTALKINQIAAEREAEFESIAATLGLDIDRIALEIVSEPSPDGRRQVVRRINKESFKGSSIHEVVSFDKLSMMNLPTLNKQSSRPGLSVTTKQQSREKPEKPVPTLPPISQRFIADDPFFHESGPS